MVSDIDILSPTGQCRTFDNRANGTVLSEGVGMVVLKRLAEAQADGDAIYGVIAASGLNQDGASNGITHLMAVRKNSLFAACISSSTSTRNRLVTSKPTALQRRWATR